MQKDIATAPAAAALLREIARCPIISANLSDSGAVHPCTTIIQVQGTRSLVERHLPEPWNGSLERSSILFVSSNPSINELEQYPRGNWSDELMTDFFSRRFGGGVKPWTVDALRPLHEDGGYAAGWVHFWASVRARAAELLGRAAVPGNDYSITEVVHCKSADEIGVSAAATFCADRYLTRLLAVSGARVVVVLGGVADAQVRRVFGLPLTGRIHGPVKLGHEERHFAFLPHPNSRIRKTFAACLTGEELSRLREVAHREGE